MSKHATINILCQKDGELMAETRTGFFECTKSGCKMVYDADMKEYYEIGVP